MNLAHDVGADFAQRHRADRAFYLAMVAVVWAAVLSGFLYHDARKFLDGTLSYPWIVNIWYEWLRLCPIFDEPLLGILSTRDWIIIGLVPAIVLSGVRRLLLRDATVMCVLAAVGIIGGGAGCD